MIANDGQISWFRRADDAVFQHLKTGLATNETISTYNAAIAGKWIVKWQGH